MATAAPKDPSPPAPASAHSGEEEQQEEEEQDDQVRSSRPSKFRFKSKSRHASHASDGGVRKRRRHADEEHRSHHHHRRSGRHKGESRPGRRKGVSSAAADYDDEAYAAWAAEAEEAAADTGREQQQQQRRQPYMDPDQAFRESLFDALADDEGAAFWEGVYGQPIHTYPNVKVGPEGELERMTDEEYTAYVRARMYEKTHQHIVEERKRKEEARKEQRRVEEEGRRLEDERMAFEQKIQESLKRGEERKAKKRYKTAWESYGSRWEKLQAKLSASSGTQDTDSKRIHSLVPWPVLTGKRADVSKEEVEDFMRNAPPEIGLQQLLKAERVRWHPDKMQQRLGGHGIDAETLQSITAVFQIIDGMWTRLRDASDNG
jgi:hypothetical protein